VQRVAAATFRRARLAAVVVGPVGRRARRQLDRLVGAGGALSP
jgi:hypothetical protein